MARKFNKLPSLTNVAKGSTATLVVPLGVTYHSITFDHAGVTLEQIKNIKVKLNGKSLQEYSDAAQLTEINKYYGRNIETGRFVLWFDRTEYDNMQLRRTTAIGTANIMTFQIEFDIDGAATNPVITATATVSQNRPSQMVTKVKKFVITNSQSGVKEVDSIPRMGAIPAMFLFNPNIVDMELSVSGTPFNELNKVQLQNLQRDYDRVPDGTKYTAIDFALEGDPTQALAVVGASDFRIKPEFSQAGSGVLVVEYLASMASHLS